MSKSVKALLLSALVFPGSGHFYLKKPIKGAILAIVSIVSLYLHFTSSIEIVQDISLSVQSGEIPLDLNSVAEALTNEAGAKYRLANLPTYFLAICWFVGVVDSYRVGR